MKNSCTLSQMGSIAPLETSTVTIRSLEWKYLRKGFTACSCIRKRRWRGKEEKEWERKRGKRGESEGGRREEEGRKKGREKGERKKGKKGREKQRVTFEFGRLSVD